jgi:hypothetical protein
MDPAGKGNVRCPLCEGEGELFRSELAAKLQDPLLQERILGWLQALENQAEELPAKPVAAEGGFAAEVRSASRRILWRRSPKE